MFAYIHLFPLPFVDGEVAHDKLVENLARWNQTDLADYIVLGSNGEIVYLSEAERAAIMSTARQAIPRDKLLVVGTGVNLPGPPWSAPELQPKQEQRLHG
jgi:dihydrodipicolinate synthase/N-acetylneuraminate lyase